MSKDTEGININSQASHEELCSMALKHYEEISALVSHWMSTVHHAIEFYKKYKDQIYTLEERVKELEAGIKTILSDLKNRREFTYIRRWDMEVTLRELLGIKREE